MRSRMVVALTALLVVVPTGRSDRVVAQQDEVLQGRLREAAQRLQQGDALGALLDLEAVLRQDDQMWEAYYYRGRAQTQLGDDIGANASFQTATSLNPGDSELCFLAATSAYAMADFTTAWEQSIRAMQAGYDRKAFGAMFKRMRRYSRQPPDLDARVKAPRVIVQIGVDTADTAEAAVIADSGEPAGNAEPAASTTPALAQGSTPSDQDRDPDVQDDPDVQELALAVRRALSAAPLVALVNEPSRARYVLEIMPGSRQARLHAAGTEEELASWPIALDRIPEMTAERLATVLGSWLSQQH